MQQRRSSAGALSAGTPTPPQPLAALENPTVLCTTSDAAAYLHKSTSTLEKYRVAGNGPRYRKLRRHVLYRLADLDAWVEAQARSSTSEAA